MVFSPPLFFVASQVRSTSDHRKPMIMSANHEWRLEIYKFMIRNCALRKPKSFSIIDGLRQKRQHQLSNVLTLGHWFSCPHDCVARVRTEYQPDWLGFAISILIQLIVPLERYWYWQILIAATIVKPDVLLQSSMMQKGFYTRPLVFVLSSVRSTSVSQNAMSKPVNRELAFSIFEFITPVCTQ